MTVKELREIIGENSDSVHVVAAGSGFVAGRRVHWNHFTEADRQLFRERIIHAVAVLLDVKAQNERRGRDENQTSKRI